MANYAKGIRSRKRKKHNITNCSDGSSNCPICYENKMIQQIKQQQKLESQIQEYKKYYDSHFRDSPQEYEL